MHTIFRNDLEDKVDMLLYIGRDEAERGRSGFNVDFELELTKRYDAYRFLVKNDFIKVAKEERVSDSEHSVIFVECNLTEKGKNAYETLEAFYKCMVESMIPYLA